MIGDIVGDTWELKRKVGKGTFSSLFVGRNILLDANDSQQYVAIKIPHDESAVPVATEVAATSTASKALSLPASTGVIRWESEVLRSLDGITDAPRFIHYGQSRGKDFLVMEIMKGDDMAHVRDRLRSKAAIISMTVASYLSRQMLSCIKAVHAKGYVHRDIKPANFIRRSNEGNDYCIIDFGIAKQYRDKLGVVKAERETADFRGTHLYASPYTHMKQDQCPRDDVYSIVYVFFDLIAGRLPWSEAAKNKDRQQVGVIKHEFLHDPVKFVDWIREEIDNVKAAKVLAQYSSLSTQSQGTCIAILKYLNSLTYEDTPDYAFIDASLAEMSDSSSNDDFSWHEGGADKLQSIDDRRGVDVAQQVKILCAKARHTGKSIMKSKKSILSDSMTAASTSVNEKGLLKSVMLTDITLAQEFEVLLNELVRIDATHIEREVVDLFEAIMRDGSNFFYCVKDDQLPGTAVDGNGSDDWKAFMKRQRVIYDFSVMHDAVIKRPRKIIT